MLIARMKVLAYGLVCCAAVSTYCQRAEAEPLRLDCIPAAGVMGAGAAGWSATIDYSAHTVWFGILNADGSLGYALVTTDRVQISETTIKWQRAVRWQGRVVNEDISINRSTGVLYYQTLPSGQVLTAQCEVYKGPGPKKF